MKRIISPTPTAKNPKNQDAPPRRSVASPKMAEMAKAMPGVTPGAIARTMRDAIDRPPTAGALFQPAGATHAPQRQKPYATPPTPRVSATPLATPLATPTAVMKKSKTPLPIDGRLDLHGMTADQGFAALDSFFYRMRTNRHRRLLIITGKGTGVMKKTLQQF